MIDPIQLFTAELAQARETEPFDATAAALATADLSGMPSVRFVLVKQVDARGFTFYTNSGSRKGRELAGNPQAALAFHWHTRGQQFRIEGSVERVDDDESDRYFATRPRESQLGAWASSQSNTIVDRATLEAQLRAVEQRVADDVIVRPPYWGGYRLKPTRIEFWQDRPGRLHDRLLYTLASGKWHESRLQP